ALVAVRIFRRHSAATRHAILSIALIFAALMPALNLVLPPLEVVIPGNMETRPVELPGSDFPGASSLPNEAARDTIEFGFRTPTSRAASDIAPIRSSFSESISLAGAAIWVWLTGAVACFA